MKVLDINQQFSWLTCERLDQEAAMDTDFQPPKPPKWLAFGMQDNGKIIIMSNYDRSVRPSMGDTVFDNEPTAPQLAFGMDVLKGLNKEIAHNGSWLVAWTHPPHFSEYLRVNPQMEWKRLVMIFLDKDGDPQFTVDSVRPFWEQVQSGAHHFVDQCEQAIQEWKQQLQILDLKENQTINLAQSGK